MISRQVVVLAGLIYLAKGYHRNDLDSASQTLPAAERTPEEAAPFPVFVQESPWLAVHGGSLQKAKIKQAPLNLDKHLRVSKAPKKRKKKRRKGRKKMRQVKVRPRGGRHIKDTYQELRSSNMQNTEEEIYRIRATTPTVVRFEPIHDKSTGNSYTQEELLKLCHETENTGAKFGITDISSFAGSNCALIQLYYPEVSCEQINVFLEYCQRANAHI